MPTRCKWWFTALAALSTWAMSTWPAARLGAEEEAQRFVESLREAGYYDVATQYLQWAVTSPLVSEGFKSSIPYEEGVTIVRQASSLPDATQAERQLRTAVVKFDEFLKNNPDSKLKDNINPLMKDAIEKDLPEGRGNVAVDVTTAGTTVAALKKGLNGTASMNLRDGAIKGINLAKTFRETKAVFTTRKDAVQQAKQTEKTDFSELTGTFRIANGVARNDDLSMKSPFIRLGGAGDINIGEDRMDYLAKASVVASAGGQGGKDLDHLKGMPVPVRVSGPFDKLSYNIEFGGLVAEAAKAKVEEKLKETVKGGKPEDMLKGLFKK